VKCPGCKTELAALALIPDDQRFTLNITGEGGVLGAETVGGTISAIRKLMLATAKHNGERVEVFVEKISQEAGTLSVGFLVLAWKKGDPRPSPSSEVPPMIHSQEKP
jgi:hypothetical protein